MWREPLFYKRRIFRWNWLKQSSKDERSGGFRPDPIPANVLKQILEQAIWAPSWANTQPWEFAVASGKKLQEINKLVLAKGTERAYPDIARPPLFPEIYLNRIKAQMPQGPPQTKEQMEARRVTSMTRLRRSVSSLYSD